MAEQSGTAHPVEDRLVVATPHVGVVQQALRRRDVQSRVCDHSIELGLTLLGLPPEQVARAAAAHPGPFDGVPEPLDRLLGLLYGEFRTQFGGWVPTMGKNRVVRPIAGAHNIGGGGQLAPTVAESRPALRDAEPGRGVRVGVADTAFYPHPWLADACTAAPSARWHPDDPAPYPVGHATFVAGLVLRQAPGAALELRRVLGPEGTADSWDVACDLVRFARSGLDILNLSFGCLTEDNMPPLVLATALNRLDPNVVVVAAAGNHGATADGRRPVWPAAFERVVAVGAIDEHGHPQGWSPAPELPWIDVVAPGKDVQSTYLPGKVQLDGPDAAGLGGPFDGFATWSGTSFAAARVTGSIAARTVPGQAGAATALRDLLAAAPRLPESAVPRVG